MGKFYVQKSNCNFSRIEADQNHEKMNAKIEGVQRNNQQTSQRMQQDCKRG